MQRRWMTGGLRKGGILGLCLVIATFIHIRQEPLPLCRSPWTKFRGSGLRLD